MGLVGYGGEVGMKVLLKIVCGTAMFFAVLFAAKGFMNGNVAMGVGALAAVWAAHWIGFKGASEGSAVKPLAAFQPPAPSGEAEISRMVDAALENGDYSPEEEQAISARAAQLQIRGDGEGGRKMWQAAYYRDLLAGRPRKCPVPWPAGFVSEPNERLIWAWDAEVLVWKTDKAYVGSTGEGRHCPHWRGQGPRREDRRLCLPGRRQGGRHEQGTAHKLRRYVHENWPPQARPCSALQRRRGCPAFWRGQAHDREDGLERHLLRDHAAERQAHPLDRR